MISEKIRPAAFKHVEAELYAFHDTKKEILRLREQIIFGSTHNDENVGGGRSSEPGRPTERIATRLTTNRRLRNLEEIEQAIESTLDMLDGSQLKMVKLKYFSKRRLSWQYIADECHIHEQTAYKYRRMIVQAIAEKIGWM
jgi:RinA family phage transcriptional activator